MFGKTAQFKQVLKQNWQPLYRVAYAWTHDSHLAADLVQETLARCLQNARKFTQADDVTIWLFKVMKNCWTDHLRQLKPQVNIQDVELQASHSLEDEHHLNQILRHVQRAMRHMNLEHREILSLVVMQNFSYEEIARILDVPVGTVMSRLSRARNRLRELLKDIDIPNANTATLWRVK